MPYIGNSPGTGTRNRFIYTATASQTTFSGADDNGKTLKYADSDYVDVYLNGICLVPVTDYTSTSKTSIVLTQAASLNDTLEVVAYDIATISDTVSKADGGTFNDGITITTADNTTQLTLESTDADASVGPVLDLHRNSSSPADADTIGEIAFKGQNDADETLSYGFIKGFISDASDGTEDGQLNVNTMIGGTSRQRIKMDSIATVFNEEGRDIDFRVESDGDAHAFFVQGSDSKVAINNNDFLSTLHVRDTGANSGSLRVGGSGASLGLELSYDQAGSTTSIIQANPTYTSASQLLKIRADGDLNPDHLVLKGNGYVGINNNNPDYMFSVYTNAMSVAAEFGRNTDSSQRTMMLFRSNSQGANVGSIQVTNSATAYNTSSDHRLKENVETLSGGITRVKQLKPKRFSWIVDEEDSANVDGFLAHEAQTVVPEAVSGTHNGTEPIGNVTNGDGDTIETGVVEPERLDEGCTWTATGTQPVYQGIDQAKLVPLLTAALQEAIAKIETLETKVAALEAG